jgi:hypothetical protein
MNFWEDLTDIDITDEIIYAEDDFIYIYHENEIIRAKYSKYEKDKYEQSLILDMFKGACSFSRIYMRKVHMLIENKKHRMVLKNYPFMTTDKNVMDTIGNDIKNLDEDILEETKKIILFRNMIGINTTINILEHIVIRTFDSGEIEIIPYHETKINYDVSMNESVIKIFFKNKKEWLYYLKENHHIYKNKHEELNNIVTTLGSGFGKYKHMVNRLRTFEI